MKYTCLCLTLVLFTGCFSRSSSDAEETFKYWAGTNVPDNIEVINGQYFQSPHFTLEYELYLEFNTTSQWWEEFVQDNDLTEHQQMTNNDSHVSKPEWFSPTDSFSIFSKNDNFDRSRYYFHTGSGRCFVYETVGM